jgi:hypothetical protein
MLSFTLPFGITLEGFFFTSRSTSSPCYLYLTYSLSVAVMLNESMLCVALNGENYVSTTTGTTRTSIWSVPTRLSTTTAAIHAATARVSTYAKPRPVTVRVLTTAGWLSTTTDDASANDATTRLSTADDVSTTTNADATTNDGYAPATNHAEQHQCERTATRTRLSHASVLLSLRGMVVGLHLVVHWFRVVFTHHHAAARPDDAEQVTTGDDTEAVRHLNQRECKYGLDAASWWTIYHGAKRECERRRYTTAELLDKSTVFHLYWLVGGLHLGQPRLFLLPYAHFVAGWSHDVQQVADGLDIATQLAWIGKPYHAPGAKRVMKY